MQEPAALGVVVDQDAFFLHVSLLPGCIVCGCGGLPVLDDPWEILDGPMDGGQFG